MKKGVKREESKHAQILVFQSSKYNSASLMISLRFMRNSRIKTGNY
jgi:hypothetical protein